MDRERLGERVRWGVVKRLGARVNPKASIEIKEAARQHCSDSVTIVFNRPANRPDAPSDEGRENAVALIRSANHWAEESTSLRFKATHLRALAPAGSLMPKRAACGCSPRKAASRAA